MEPIEPICELAANETPASEFLHPSKFEGTVGVRDFVMRKHQDIDEERGAVHEIYQTNNSLFSYSSSYPPYSKKHF